MTEDEREDAVSAEGPAGEPPGWKRRRSGGVLLWTFIALLAGVFIGVWITYTALRGAPGNMAPPPPAAGQESTIGTMSMATGAFPKGFPEDFPVPEGKVLESRAATSASGSSFVVRMTTGTSVDDLIVRYERFGVGIMRQEWKVVKLGYSAEGGTRGEASFEVVRDDAVGFVDIVARGSGSEVRISILGVKP
jgi:uncharacterized protein YneF (UPF0154 family)